MIVVLHLHNRTKVNSSYLVTNRFGPGKHLLRLKSKEIIKSIYNKTLWNHRIAFEKLLHFLYQLLVEIKSRWRRMNVTFDDALSDNVLIFLERKMGPHN